MLVGSIVATCLLFLVHCATACTDTVYVGTADGYLAISKDGGETWSTVLRNGGKIWSISAHDDNVYAMTASGLAVSHDGGAIWTIKDLGFGCSPAVASVFVDEGKRVYALIGYNTTCVRVAVSSDNGDTWPINFPFPYAFSPWYIYVDGPRMYVATSGGLGISDDLGTTWTFKNQSNGLGSSAVYSVIGRGQTIYAGLNIDGGAISISKDGGITWTTVTTSSTGVNYVCSINLQEDTLYAATYGGGLVWSNDFTSSTSPTTTKTTANGLASNNTWAIMVSGNNLYLGTDNGLSISRDNGRTWITKTTKDDLPGNDIYGVFAQCV